MDQSRIPTSLLLCYLLRHSSERCCTYCSPASASAGPDHHFHFFPSNIGEATIPAFIQDRQPHGNGTGRYTLNLLSFFFHYVVIQAAPHSEVVRSRESVRIPVVSSTLVLCAGKLVGRRRQCIIGKGSIPVCGWLGCC